GLVAGFRVALVLGNCTEFVTSYLGALRAQLVAVPLNPHTDADGLAAQLLGTGARLVVVDERRLPTVRQATATFQAPPRLVVTGAVTGVGVTSYEELVSHEVRPLPPGEDVEALAVLLHTPDASGRPRAAMLTHRALLANIDQIAAVEPPMVGPDDVVLAMLPLFHVYGLNAVLGTAVRQRARLVLADHFDASDTLDLIAEHGVTVVPVAPAAIRRWLQVDDLPGRFASVRVVLSGSAPLSPAKAQAFTERTGVPVHQGYGLTEAAPVVTSTLCSTSPQPGSAGAVLPGIEVRVLDED